MKMILIELWNIKLLKSEPLRRKGKVIYNKTVRTVKNELSTDKTILWHELITTQGKRKLLKKDISKLYLSPNI